MEYDVSGGGLFVIIKQFTEGLNKLNYEPDVKQLKELMGHKETSNSLIDMLEQLSISSNTNKPESICSNVLEDTNLTNGKGDHSFHCFMEKVKAYRKNNPSFIMFMLMSHGSEDGKFALVTPQYMKEEVTFTQNCCAQLAEGEHLDDCGQRYLVTDVIKVIDAWYPGKPKIYLVQCCRGSSGSAVKVGEADPSYVPSDRSDSELFIPNSSDTLVFRACIEGNQSYVTTPSAVNVVPEGSLFIQYFCQVLKELIGNSHEYTRLLEEVEKEEPSKKLRKLESSEGVREYLQRSREDFCGGWIMNVCQRTTALVTNYLLITMCLSKHKLGRLLSLSEEDMNVKLGNNLDETVTLFIESLKDYKSHTQHPVQLERIINICLCDDMTRQEARAIHMLMYMWHHIRQVNSQLELIGELPTLVEEVKSILGVILEELRCTAQCLYKKQQPHVSSSLSRNFSCIKMINSVNRDGLSAE